MENRTLDGQIVLIIGAGRGPGPALAAALAAQGAVVAINDLSPVLLDPIVETITAQGGQARSYVADAARGMPVRAMLDEVLEDWGRVDILINNPRVQPETELLNTDEWDWQRTVEMNLNGPFLITQLSARLMREQGGGMIINIVDANAATLEKPGHAAYAASQAGLLSLSQSAARELIAYNIRVYTLCPEDAVLHAQTAQPLCDLVVNLGSSAGAQVPGQVFQVQRKE